VILEQMVHRGLGEVGLYGRAGFAPPDRNASGLGFDGGVNWEGFLPGRDDDIAGVGFAYAGLTGGAIDELRREGVEAAGAEMVVEATYQAVVTPWLSVQPDVQYVIQPGADRGLGNALVVGCRVSVVF
jgi:porin